MKKSLIIFFTLIFGSIPAFASNELGRYDFTDKLVFCQKMKDLTQESNGSSNEGLFIKGGLDNFISDCLNNYFDSNTIKPLGKVQYCESKIFKTNGCDYSLPSVSPNNAIVLKTISNNKDGIAYFKCNANSTWSLIEEAKCDSSLNNYCDSNEKFSFTQNAKCYGYLKSGNYKDKQYLVNINPAYKGNARYICEKNGQGGYSWQYDSYQSCTFSCALNTQINWNYNGNSYTGTIKASTNSIYYANGKSGTEFSYVIKTNDNEEFNKNTSFFYCQNKFNCNSSKWLVDGVYGSCKKITSYTDPLISCNDKSIFKKTPDGDLELQYKVKVCSWR